MDGLTGYQQRRLELGDLIRAVLAIVHAHEDEQREQVIRGLLTRLAAGRFQLAVIGQFSRGKTTLMNALLGNEYLPMGALPMTSVVTTVRYGTQARALVRSSAAALAVEIPVSEAARFVARASSERTRMQATSVEMEIPAELLRLGFEFVDTPGVGSTIAANTAATLRYLPQADAVVFVTGFDSALTSAEADFLGRAATQAGKLFVVINKRDLVSDAEVAEVTQYVRRWVRDRLPTEPPVFAISALQGLAGAVNGDLRQLADSGVGPLRGALTRFLTAERGRIALSTVAAAAAGLVARQERDLRAGQRADGGPAPDSIVAGFESQLSGLQDQLATVADRIAATADTAVTDFLAERAPGAAAELAELLAPAAALPSDAAVPDGDPVAGAIDALRLAGRQAVGDWLARRTAELGETLIAAAAEDIGDLLHLARSPRELGAAVAGLPTFADAPAGWTAEDIPRLTLPVVDWTVPDPPTGYWRRRGLRSTADAASREVSAAIAAAVADFGARAGAAFRLVAAAWTRRLGEQAGRLAAAEAAQFRRYLVAPARDDDLVVLADLGRRLADFRDSLAAWTTEGGSMAAGSDAEPAAAPIADTGGTCAICAQQEAAQTGYLIRRQFLLATSEADQARHAETGGFCPLHTWQYAHLASPVGISAGNARLANQQAAALRDAAAHSRDPGELAGYVAELARRAACPACAVLAATERTAADELAARKPGVAEPRLCLRHLALVLERCASLPVGRGMTGALAATLQRASEDMRAYALKREALSRGLITADEASASSDALRLLAGPPSLALPAIPD